MNTNSKIALAVLAGAALGAVVVILTASAASVPLRPILPNLSTPTSVSVVGGNGDINPYGVAFVPVGFVTGGKLNPGDIIVSDFNNSTNVQGTGTSIVRVPPTGQTSVFFQEPAANLPNLQGFTTALGVLSAGFVLVGNVPNDGNGGALQGALQVIDHLGNLVEAFTDPNLLDGPWDLTVHDEGDQAQVFVTNVLSGTVTRIDFQIPAGGIPLAASMTQIASGYAHRSDPNAFVVGPTGLAYDANKDVLYVASTGDNMIFAIPSAGNRTTDAGMGDSIFKDNHHLHGPLGLALAPNGDLLTSNGDAVKPDRHQLNEIVEFTAKGTFVAEIKVDNGAAGAAFGIALAQFGNTVKFAAVDDNTNDLEISVAQITKP